MILIKMIVLFLVILKMHEIDKTKLSDQIKFKLYEIKIIEIYFINEIKQQNMCSKKLSRYVTIFYYIDIITIILSETSSSVSIISFTSVIGASAGIASATYTLYFSITTAVVKKLLNITNNKKKSIIKFLC